MPHSYTVLSINMLKKESINFYLSFDFPTKMIMLFNVIIFLKKIKCISRDNTSENSNLGIFRG